MNKNFCVIGGDLRIIKLAEMLAKEENKVYTYGLDKAYELENVNNIIFEDSLQNAAKKSSVVIGPIPFTSNGKNINSPFSNKKIIISDLFEVLHNKTLMAGSISEEILENCNSSTTIIDLMKMEELAVLNTIATAEGTIKIAIENTDKILQSSNVLILGFGRIGKVLANKMKCLDVNVTCAARKNKDLAWIKACGYNQTDINELKEELSKYDIIINTVPNMILTKDKLKFVKSDCLLIDNASKPGGIDQDYVKEKKLKFIWALALPGKVAPITSAQFIKDTIYNVLKQRNI